MQGRGKPQGEPAKEGSASGTLARANVPVDRVRLVAWLLDKARDVDELAEHVGRKAEETDRSMADAVAFRDESILDRERARAYRDVAAQIERGDPDVYTPPDLVGRERRSSAAAALRPDATVAPYDSPSARRSGEHAIDVAPAGRKRRRTDRP